jgi:hypothetical protein
VRAPFALAFLFAACAAGAPPPQSKAPPAPGEPPAYVAEPGVAWAAGHPFGAGLAPGAPDEAPWRAMAIWWREALRQSNTLRLDDTGAAADRLELGIDPNARQATAEWVRGGERTVIASVAFRDGNVPAAIDTLAVAARNAVGDASPAAVGCAAGTSARHEVVDAAADAVSLLRDGGFAGARRILRDGRRRDANAPWLLEPLAACEAALGDHATAERLCTEALAATSRLLPATRHRLQRTLSLARAAQQPLAAAAATDAELRRLGARDRRQRPHDLEPRRTEALATALAGDFDAAGPLLDDLLALDGDAPNTLALAGHVKLALGDPKAAAAHFAAVRGRLPAAATLLGHAEALFASGDRKALRELLDRALDDACTARDPYEVDVRQMRAALFLAEGDDAALRRELATILAWLVARPAALAARSADFRDLAALLAERGDRAEVERLSDRALLSAAGAAIAAAVDALRAAASPQEFAALRACKPDAQVRLRGPWTPPMRGPAWMAATLGR